MKVHRLRPLLALSFWHPGFGLQVADRLRQLNASQWAKRQEIDALQYEKLRMLIAHVRERVPAYLDYKSIGLGGPESVREQLAEYPIVGKSLFRAHPEAVHQAQGLPRFIVKASTGGTTGPPIPVWHSRRSMSISAAAYWRGKSWRGVGPRSRGVSARSLSKASFLGGLRLTLLNQHMVDTFGRSPSELGLLVEKLRLFRAEYLEGYVSQVLLLAEACCKAGIQIPSVFTTGEMLFGHQRQQLQETFTAQVSDYYGSNEVAAVAFECENGVKHVTDEHVILETVDDGGNPVWDQPGRILLTDLDNYVTPFIRYEICDRGTISKLPCSCGRALTVLHSIDGREQDFLTNAVGGRLSTLFFAGRFRDLQELTRIQFIQRSIDEIDLLYEAPETNDEIVKHRREEQLHQIQQEIRERLGQHLRVRCRRVKELIRSGRGKCRLIIPIDDAAQTQFMEIGR